jgi:vacuolar protein sorting-associated protein 13A/C
MNVSYTGMGKGVAGAVVKPVAGILDWTKRTAEGMQTLTDISDERERKRKPRLLYGTSRTIKAYDEEDAMLKGELSYVDGRCWSVHLLVHTI